ncbi:MAG: glycosyltransferase family 4 protein [Planctomycetes bacterium]|nr:glycosyltransferase family 4 protein [Planctomycetota bacterium]
MTTPTPAPRWIVAQIGSREHYAVPRAFHRRGHLHTLYTDAWIGAGAGLLRRGPKRLRGLAGRHHPEIPSRLVCALTFRAMLTGATFALRKPTSTPEQFRAYLRTGERFAADVRRRLEHSTLDPALDAYFGYDTGCLETLQLLRERSVVSVVDQIDPARTEEQLVFEESQRWPGWQAVPGRIPDDYYQRLSAEWDLASLVLVNSDWSRDALVKQGVPMGKIIVVPLAYEPSAAEPPVRKNSDRPITVLWLGSVILRKGIQYLIEAARRLTDTKVRFVVAGPVQIAQKVVGDAPNNMEFIGRVTRDRIEAVYRAADVFVLPTLSDGFAITQLEAMAQGLPVIATPNCGRVVEDGVDGLIVPAGDAESLARAVAGLDQDRALLSEMSRRAIEKSRQFTLERYADTLESAVRPLMRK